MATSRTASRKWSFARVYSSGVAPSRSAAARRTAGSISSTSACGTARRRRHAPGSISTGAKAGPSGLASAGSAAASAPSPASPDDAETTLFDEPPSVTFSLIAARRSMTLARGFELGFSSETAANTFPSMTSSSFDVSSATHSGPAPRASSRASAAAAASLVAAAERPTSASSDVSSGSGAATSRASTASSVVTSSGTARFASSARSTASATDASTTDASAASSAVVAEAGNSAPAFAAGGRNTVETKRLSFSCMETRSAGSLGYSGISTSDRCDALVTVSAAPADASPASTARPSSASSEVAWSSGTTTQSPAVSTLSASARFRGVLLGDGDGALRRQ